LNPERESLQSESTRDTSRSQLPVLASKTPAQQDGEFLGADRALHEAIRPSNEEEAIPLIEGRQADTGAYERDILE
jgi:hypothetical protein